MSSGLKFLLSICGVQTILLILVSAYAYVLRADNIVLSAANVDLSERLGRSEKSVTLLKDSLRVQNTAVTRLKRDAEQRAKEGERELAKAKVETDKYARIATGILEGGGLSGDQCSVAAELINQEIQRGKE